jgi:hypothetical protein
MSKNTIEWIAKDELTHALVPAPKPARDYLPEWYKELPTSRKGVDPENGTKIPGQLKDCMPFLDALTSGYIQESWADVHFSFGKDQNENIICHWKTPLPTGYEEVKLIDKTRLVVAPPPNGFHPIEFALKVPWLPKTPNGWSALITPVMNRFDLPWQTMFGIIDSDKFYHFHGHIPFYVKNTGLKELLVPAGTPMYQITPIKRQDWKSFFEEKYDKLAGQKRGWEYIVKSFSPVYIKNMWTKKKYE